MPDVVVIGAGVVGLAVGEELARRGLEVELFERQPQVAQEASGAAAGILDPQGADGPGPMLELLRTGFPLVAEMIRRLESASGLDLGYRACGMMGIVFTDEDAADLDRERRWQGEAGLVVERLDRRQVTEAEPAVSSRVRGGVWWPRVSQVDVTRMGAAYQRLFEQSGGVLKLGLAVERFLVERDQVVGVETRQGRVHAGWVVDCAGPWAALDSTLPWEIPSIPCRGQIIQFSVQQPLLRSVVRSARAYLVQRFPRQLLAGTTVEYVGFDRSVTEEGQRAIREGACEICPGLSSIPVTSAWAGLRPDSPDHLPILGPTPLDRLLVASGHFRNGILLAPLTGRLIAELITRGDCSIDLSPFKLARFVAKAARDVVK